MLPIAEIDDSITSPGSQYRVAGTRSGSLEDQFPPKLGSFDQAVPAGVPVRITIPGLRVKLIEKKWINSAQVQIMSAVDDRCRSSPLISVERIRSCGSAIVPGVGYPGTKRKRCIERFTATQLIPRKS